MRRFVIGLFALNLSVFDSRFIALAQEALGGGVAVYGSVTSRDEHRPIADVAVTIDGPVRRTVRTARDGSFEVLSLPQGSYTLEFDAAGFEPLREKNLNIAVASQITVELARPSTLREIGRVSVSSSAFNITPAAVTSLSSTQLSQYGFDGYRRDLEELPGVTILKESQGNDQRGQGNEYAGTPYGQSFVTIRGALPYQSSVLFDGHRLNSADREGFQYGTNIAAIDPYAFRQIDIVAGPGATSPTVNNAVGGTAQFLTGRAGSRPRAEFDVGNDGIGSTTLHAGIEGRAFDGRLGAKLDLTNITTDFPTNYPASLGYIPWGEAAFNPVSAAGAAYSKFGTNGFPALGGIVRPAIDPNWGDPTLSVACCYNFNVPTGGFRRSATGSVRYDLSSATSVSGLFTTTTQYAQDAFSVMRIPFEPAAGAATYGIPRGTELYATNSIDANPNGAYADAGDQIGEFELRSTIGQASIRASYLTQSDKQHTFYPLGWPAGNYKFYGSGTNADGTPAVLDGQTYQLGDPVYFNRDDSGINITRDALFEFAQPMGSSNLSLSLDDTFSTGTLQQNFNGNRILASDPISSNLVQSPPSGVFQTFIAEHLEYDADIAAKLRSYSSLYVNQYHFRGAQSDASGAQTGTFDTVQAYTTPRFALEYRPASAVAYRASVGGAISPLDVSLYNNVGGVPQPNSMTAPTFYTQSIAPSGLRPETSFGEDVGASLQFAHATSLSADLYNTAVSGQFYTSYQRLGLFDGLPLYAAQPSNLGRSRFYGVNLTAAHVPARGLTWSIAGALQRSYAYDIPNSIYYNPNDPTSPNNIGIVPNLNFNGYDGLTAIPYAQGRATLGYRLAKFEAAAGATYYGSNNAYYQPAFFAVDITGSVRLSRATSLNFGAVNLSNANGGLRDDPNEFRTLPVIGGSAASPYQYGSNIVYPQVYGPPALSVNLREAFLP